MKMYKISEDELRRIFHDALAYEALDCGGVDNWSWYGESLSNYIKDYVKENDIDISPNELTIADIAEHSLVYFEPVKE